MKRVGERKRERDIDKNGRGRKIAKQTNEKKKTIGEKVSEREGERGRGREVERERGGRERERERE